MDNERFSQTELAVSVALAIDGISEDVSLAKDGALFQESRESLMRQLAERTADLQECNRRLSEEAAMRQHVERLLQTRQELEHYSTQLAVHIPGFLSVFCMSADGRFSFPFTSEGIRGFFDAPSEGGAGLLAGVDTFVHPEDRFRVGKAIQKSASDFTRLYIEFRVLHPEKGEIWIESRSCPECERDGSILWRGVMLDITERKQVEDAVNASEAKYRAVFELSNDGFFLHRIVEQNGKPEFILCDLNPRGCELWGYSREDILSGSLDLFEMNNPPYSFEEANRRKWLAAAGEPQLFDWEVKRGDGNKIWGEVNLRHIQVAGEDYLLTVMRDINERKRMESVLAMREQEYRSLTNALPDHIARWDLAGRYLYVNAIHARALAMSAPDLIGKTNGEVFPDGRFTAVDTAIAQVAATGQAVLLMRQHVPFGDGQMRIHDVNLVLERDADGKVVAVLGIGRDMTELYHLQDDLAAREREFRTLAENSPDPIYRYDHDCRRLYVNPVVGRITGKPVAELIGRTPADGAILISEQNKKLMQAIRSVFDSGETGHIDIEFNFQDGLHHDYHMLLVPECNTDGQVMTVLALARDITTIRNAERRMTNFLGNVPGFVYTYRMSPEGHASLPFASRGIGDLYGLRPEDVQDDIAPLRVMTHPEDTPCIEKAIAESARAASPLQIEFRMQRPGWPERWIESHSMPERQSDGSTHWHGIMLDITERKRMEELAQRSAHDFRTLVENLPDPLFRYDRDCRRTYVSPAVERITGKKPDELLRQAPHDAPLAIASENDRLVCDIRRVLETGRPTVGEVEYIVPDGRLLHFQNHLGPECAADGSVIGVLSIMRDITERKHLEERLRKREQEFRTLVENSPDTIARYDRDCCRVYANPRLVASMGGDLTRILGSTPAQFPGGASALEYENLLRQVLEQGGGRNVELRWQTEGVEFCAQIRMTPERDSSGQVAHVLAIGRDISEIDQYRQKIHHQAFFDSLTGLPNRRLLSDHISQAAVDAAYHGRQFGLMLVDLDNFKTINDTLGHDAGDSLLCEAAKRMQNCVRVYDTVARLGGDEFSVLLPDMRKGGDLATIADKILHALAEPFTIEGRELFITCSIGIALYPDDSTDANALHKYADSAMYQAKKMGRNNFQFYAKELTRRSLDRMEIETGLRKVQKNGELVLYYQPQIELRTGRVTGAEALLRWNRPGHGLVAPDQFISIAEDTGLIVDIGEWVLRTACTTAVNWNCDRDIPIKIAVNLSTRQFTRNDLVGSVRRILVETGCKSEWLELEITESLLLEDSNNVAAMLAVLHGMGLSISIDDFGTGYSALSYLNRFPVSQLKIDRSFVQDIPERRDKSELVKAMLSITAALGLESVAEGVETAEQAEYLLVHGCQLAQGYLFGRPMPRVDFEAWLSSRYIFVTG